MIRRLKRFITSSDNYKMSYFFFKIWKRVFEPMLAAKHNLYALLGIGKKRLPDFIGIGAQKAATSWLYHMLHAHPDIYVPLKKETHYFDRRYPQKNTAWYTYFFRKAGKRKTGEITPAYSILEPETIAHVYKTVPNARLILLLRNPIERAWSHALMDLSSTPGRPIEDIPDEEFFRHFDDAGSINRGDYDRVISNWLSAFPQDQLCIGYLEEIMRDPQPLLKKIYAHIGVTDEINWDGVPFQQKIHGGQRAQIPERFEQHLRTIYTTRMKALHKRLGNPIIEEWMK